MKKIIVKIGKKYSFVNMNEIKWIESDKGYLKIFVDDNYFLVKMSLKEIMTKLDSNDFIRISQSRIINALKIKEMTDSNRGNEFSVLLNDNTRFQWGRHYRKNFPGYLLLK